MHLSVREYIMYASAYTLEKMNGLYCPNSGTFSARNTETHFSAANWFRMTHSRARTELLFGHVPLISLSEGSEQPGPPLAAIDIHRGKLGLCGGRFSPTASLELTFKNVSLPEDVLFFAPSIAYRRNCFYTVPFSDKRFGNAKLFLMVNCVENKPLTLYRV
jgi:hypothetical protein